MKDRTVNIGRLEPKCGVNLPEPSKSQAGEYFALNATNSVDEDEFFRVDSFQFTETDAA